MAGNFFHQGGLSGIAFGTIYTLLAVSDVFLARTVLGLAGKGLMTVGGGALTVGRGMLGRGATTQAAPAATQWVAERLIARLAAAEAVQAFYLAEAASRRFAVKLWLYNAVQAVKTFGSAKWIKATAIHHLLKSHGLFTVAKFGSRIDPILTPGGATVYGIQGAARSSWWPSWFLRSVAHHEMLHVAQVLRNPGLIATEQTIRATYSLVSLTRLSYILRVEALPQLLGSPGFLAPLTFAPVYMLRYYGGDAVATLLTDVEEGSRNLRRLQEGRR